MSGPAEAPPPACARYPRGRFTLLTAPSLLTWLFLLLRVLCERQQQRLDGAILARETATRLHAVFFHATGFSALAAALFMFWPLFRGRNAPDFLAFFINLLTAILVLPFAFLVH